jgi:hypothetical protein
MQQLCRNPRRELAHESYRKCFQYPSLGLDESQSTLVPWLEVAGIQKLGFSPEMWVLS